ncbi:1,3-beta-glucanosyltransferase [Mycena albidolilacea]|uniref:1,3-beta-glucanosyltransferase n=1 Tax=Mycena albidolilacea TaxID=1033008 RepID=A0AAD6Z8Y6_9AGAR|nr:1,3-beta-glucanosyltransferase [Mycena albidolilacea]
MKIHFMTLASSAVLGLVTSTSALPKVARTGRYLYDEDGTRFYPKGIAYQTPFITDNLADAAGDSSLNHDACMNALSAAEIYVMLELALPYNGSIDTVQPSWSTNLLSQSVMALQYIKTIDTFAKYDNLLAFNVGNEVIMPNATSSAPFIKAAVRDIKAYLTSISSSALVGYATIDGTSAFRHGVAEYLACDPSGSNSGSSSIDFFGLNSYEQSLPATAARLTTDFEEFPFTIAACVSRPCDLMGLAELNEDRRSEFVIGSLGGGGSISDSLFSQPTTDVLSGGIAYSYFPDRGFGVTNVSSDGRTVTTNGDFDDLVAQYSQVSFVNSPAKASVPASSFAACHLPSSLNVSLSLPPTPNKDACECLESKLSCVFSPASRDYSKILGDLTGKVCGLLPGVNGSCADISGDGTAGSYGAVAMCDPTIRLSYAFSQYYELSGRVASSCVFDGNANLSRASTEDTFSSAVATCIPNSAQVSTPNAPVSGLGSSNSALPLLGNILGGWFAMENDTGILWEARDGSHMWTAFLYASALLFQE